MARIKVLEMIDRPALGGGQSVLLSLAAHLDRDLFDAGIASAPQGPLPEMATKMGIKHFAVPLEKKLRFRAVGEIASVLKGNGIDILHTHGGFAGLYGRLAARRARTPVVVHTLHGIHYLHYRNPAFRRALICLERLCSRLSDGLVLVSYSDFGRALRHRLAPQEKMFVVLNGVPMLEPVSPQTQERKRLELGLVEGVRPIVGTVARLHRQKGVLWLIRAAPLIRARFPRVGIVIIGDGPEKKRLLREVRRRGVGENVCFLGARPDASELMSLFDVFVLPSLWEGLPLVLIEAAARGKPIVATAVDGTREVIDDGRTGLLIPPRSAQALSEATIRLLENPAEASRLAERAMAVIPRRFPLQRMVEQTQSIYLKLLAGKNAADIRV